MKVDLLDRLGDVPAGPAHTAPALCLSVEFLENSVHYLSRSKV